VFTGYKETPHGKRYLLESYGKSRDSMVVRAALKSGENSLVDLVFKIIEDLQ
jgi:hypothetical protein